MCLERRELNTFGLRKFLFTDICDFWPTVKCTLKTDYKIINSHKGSSLTSNIQIYVSIDLLIIWPFIWPFKISNFLCPSQIGKSNCAFPIKNQEYFRIYHSFIPTHKTIQASLKSNRVKTEDWAALTWILICHFWSNLNLVKIKHGIRFQILLGVIK